MKCLVYRSLPFLVLLGLAACSGKPAEVPAGAATPVVTTPEIDAKLAAADAKDGAVDKVVHRCAGCMLGMDGKEQFGLTVGAYRMHFCKQGCLERYQKDALGELARLTVK